MQRRPNELRHTLAPFQHLLCVDDIADFLHYAGQKTQSKVSYSFEVQMNVGMAHPGTRLPDKTIRNLQGGMVRLNAPWGSGDFYLREGPYPGTYTHLRFDVQQPDNAECERFRADVCKAIDSYFKKKD